MPSKILSLALVLCALSMAPALAGEQVHVALYFAANGPTAPGSVFAPERMTHRLHDVFGFQHYELVKAENVELRHEWEQWFVPRKDFFIRIQPLPRQPDSPRLIDYELYKDGFIVAKGRYEPREDTPLFINGPDFNQGRFVLVLEAR